MRSQRMGRGSRGFTADLVSIDDPMATYGQMKVPFSLTLKEAPIMNIDIAQSAVIRYIVQKTHFVCRPGGR